MGAPSLLSQRSGSRERQGASFRIASLLKSQFDQANIFNPEFQARIARLKSSGGDAVQRLAQFGQPFPEQIAQQKAELQFQATQAKAESDFLARIQSAISKQLAAFEVPQQQVIIQTPMIESESQVKQIEQSPVALIPIAIIGIILGAVLLG